jgi:hypothetical protein
MNTERLSAARRSPKPRCRRCGRFKGIIYTALCQDCVEQTLQHHLPRLKRILEVRYGRQLDEWLSVGGFTSVRWDISPDFTVDERLLRRFLKHLILEAAEGKDIWLEFAGKVTWTPTHIGQLVSFIYDRCGAELGQLIAQKIMAVIRSAPTEQAERELMDLISGRLQALWIEVLDEAVACVADTTGSRLAYGARVLIELRYKFNRYLSLYTQIDEGSIDPVWKEVADELPKSICKLLPEDEE